MKKWLDNRGTLATVVAAVVVLTVFSTGGAVAGSLITSAQIKNNTVKSIDVRDNALQGRDVRTSSLNGTDIADGSLTNNDVSVYYATLENDGTIVDQSGGVTVAKLNPGFYAVDFHRDVTKCAYDATVGSPIDEFDTGQVFVAEYGNGSAVFVNTRNVDGVTNADHPFHLVVVC